MALGIYAETMTFADRRTQRSLASRLRATVAVGFTLAVFGLACSGKSTTERAIPVASAGAEPAETAGANNAGSPSSAGIGGGAPIVAPDTGGSGGADCVPTATKKCRDASFIALGSKCLTKCPEHNLMCDNRFWKGNCTHGCMSDADCQDTGSVGVCGKDNQCYRPCSAGAKPCSRTMYSCVGDPGHTYCASDVPNPHLDGGVDVDAGEDAGVDDAGSDPGDPDPAM